MQKKNIIKSLLWFVIVFMNVINIQAHIPDQTRSRLLEDFRAPSYNTNFPSEQLFSIADIKRRTYSIKQSKALLLTRSGVYSPTSEATSSPMFQVVASTVTIDLNGQVLSKDATAGINCIGAEIGYNPVTLATDPTLTIDSQPQNIIIRNGTFDGFDIGIVVHKGVKSVRFENISFSRTPIAIIFMGDTGAGEEIASCSMSDVKIIGSNTDASGTDGSLEWARRKIETANSNSSGPANGLGFNYGANEFMNATNPVDGSDASVYSGIVVRHSNNMQFDNVLVDAMGYRDAEVNSTVTYGIDITNSKNLFFNEVNCSSNISPAQTIGCHFAGCSSLSIKNCIFSNNLAQYVAVETAGSSYYRNSVGLLLESTSAVLMTNITCNTNEASNAGDTGNESRARAYGLRWNSGAALELTDITCNHNEGNAGICCGMQFDSVESITMENILANYNHGTGGNTVAGDDATNSNNMGATGIFFSTYVKSLGMKNVAASSNYGSSVIGLRIMVGQGITASGLSCDYNNGTAFIKGISCGTSIKSCTLDDVSLVSNTSSGGIVSAATFAAAQSVEIKNALCNYNTTTGGNQNVIALQFTGSAQTVELDTIQINSNGANGTGIIKALEITAGQSILLQHAQINGNSGGGASNLIDFITSIASLTLNDVVINSNAITHATNGLNVISLTSPTNITMNNVIINGNSTSGAGTLQAFVMAPSANSIALTNVTISGNSSGTGIVRGFIATNSVGVSLVNCSISNNVNSGIGTGSVIGLDFEGTTSSLTINGLIMNGVTATGVGIPATGIYISNGVSVILTDVTCNGTTADGAAIGIYFATSAKTISLKNVTANYTNSTASTAQGIVVDSVESFIAQDISASQTTAIAGQAVQGIIFTTSAESVDIINGIFDGNSGGAVDAILIASGQNINFDQISADQNSGNGNVQALRCTGSIISLKMQNLSASNNSSSGAATTGVLLTNATAVSIENGTIDNNSSSAGNAIGLKFTSGSNSIQLKDLSVDSTTTSAASATAQGIVFDTVSNVKMIDMSVNHTISTNGTPGNVDAIKFLTSAQSIDMKNVLMSNNSGAIVHGLNLVAGSNISLSNCFADQNSGSAGVYGMEFLTSVNALDIIHSSCSKNVSTSAGVVEGCKISNGIAVNIDGLEAHYNQAAGGTNEVVGIDFATSASSITMKNIATNNNISLAGDATGLRVIAGNSVSVDHATCNYNKSDSSHTARGIHFVTSLQSGSLHNVATEGNYNGQQVIGIHLEQPLSVDMENVTSSRNNGISRAYGIFLDGQSASGANVSMLRGVINNNTTSASATLMAAPDTTATVSKHLSVNPQDAVTGFTNVLEGGFGVYIYQVDSCYFTDIEASKNTGVRAGGVYIAICNDCTLENCKTSFQQATGNYFYTSNPFSGLDNTAIDIPTAQVPTIFGETTDTTVNLLQLTKDFLHGMRNIKYLQDISEYDPNLESTYNNIAEISGAQMLMRAIMAQYRSFSTAVGVQIHDSVNCVLQDHISLGNQSANDSAIGIGISGTAEGHLIIRAKSSGNEAWVNSKADDDGDMDISATLSFWTFLATRVLSSTWAGATLSGQAIGTLTDPISSPITSAQIGRQTVNSINSADQPQPVAPVLSEPTIALDRLAIVFIASGNYPAGSLEEFCSVVGGISAGVLVGDGAVNTEFAGSDCANNKGNSGQAFGLIQDVTTSLSAKDNRLYQSTVNDLGWCSGLAEYTLQSNSVQIGNVLFANTIGDMLNSNYFVPYDPSDYPTISFPVKIGYNGDIRNFANASPFDNLVIEFIAPKQTLAYVPNNMVSYWELDDTTSGTGKEPWTNA